MNPIITSPDRVPQQGIVILSLDMTHNGRGLYEGMVHSVARQLCEERHWTWVLADMSGKLGRMYDVRHFPTLILLRDGEDLGRTSVIVHRLDGLRQWADDLLRLR